MRRLLAILALLLLTGFALNWLVQRVVAIVLVALVLLLAGCRTGVDMPPPSECHKAIRYANYARGACVIYAI